MVVVETDVGDIGVMEEIELSDVVPVEVQLDQIGALAEINRCQLVVLKQQALQEGASTDVYYFRKSVLEIEPRLIRRQLNIQYVKGLAILYLRFYFILLLFFPPQQVQLILQALYLGLELLFLLRQFFLEFKLSDCFSLDGVLDEKSILLFLSKQLQLELLLILREGVYSYSDSAAFSSQDSSSGFDLMQQSKPCSLVSCYGYLAKWTVLLVTLSEKLIQAGKTHMVLISAYDHWKIGLFIVLLTTDRTLQLD